MADTQPAPRVFTAELRRCRFRRNYDPSKPVDAPDATAPVEPGSPTASTAQTDAAPKPPSSGEPITSLAALLSHAPTIHNCDFLALQEEVSHLKDAIEQMKREIATLRTDKAPAPTLQKATCELDAVVEATEDATHNILEAAELIDTILADARAKPDEAIAPAAIEQMGDQVIRIFKSSNFQDITGQRINKVVTAMKFIENRIDRMIEIVGGKEALQHVEVAVEEEVDEDAKLLEGPQLEGDAKISQNDIDRFFD